MKKVLNFGLIVAASFMLSGCWSWQKMVSFGFWQSDEEARAERLELEKEKMVQNKEQISKNAIDLLTPKCESGDAEACNDLGVNFELMKESDNAYANYKKACDAKVQLACSNLGTLYENGLGVKKDPKKAVEIYKDSCNSGGVQACYHLGNAYRKGEIVKQDYYLAMEAYTNACNAGDLPSCANIGAMYELGLGMNKDEKRAYGIYKVACFRGLNKACPQMKRLGAKLGM